MVLVFRRFGRVAALVLLSGVAGACASNPPIPSVGESEADRYLYERGAELLARKNWLTAREYFRRLVDTYPRSQYREQAKLGIGDSFLGEGRVDSLILGANEFKEFLTYFPLSQRADYAQYRLAWAAYKQMLGPQRDQTATHEAIRELQKFVDSYAESAYRPDVEKLLREAKDRLGEHEFRVGLLYYRIRLYPGALGRLSGLLKSDPEYSKKDEVYYYLGETLVKMNAPAEALPIFERLIAEFPESKWRGKAADRVEEIKRGQESR